MGSNWCRKMTLEQKFHKTGGSHIDFHCSGTFYDGKKLVISAALPCDFFLMPKNVGILVSFLACWQWKPIWTVLKKTKIVQFNFFLYSSLLCTLKIAWESFSTLKWAKNIVFKKAKFWGNY
jgi:hypothetical protein